MDVPASGSGAPDRAAEVAELVRWSYEGEVTGAAIFSAVAERSADETRRRALRALADLEIATRDRIAPFVTRLVAEPIDEPGLTAFGRSVGEAMAGHSWLGFIEAFAPLVQQSLTHYRRLLAIAPDEETAELARALIVHEEAIGAYARGELDGEADALTPVLALLDGG